RLDRRRPATGGGRRPETPGAADENRRESGSGAEQGRAPAPRAPAPPAVVAEWAGADGGVVAAGAGGLSLGPAGGACTGEPGGAAGPASTPRAVGPAEQDPPGGGVQGPSGGRAVAAVRESDEELLERSIPLLRFSGHPTDEQRLGAPVRLASLPRAAGQRAQAGVAGSGGSGARARRGEHGHAAASRGRAKIADGLCG